MIGLPLAFAAPIALAGLILLPVLYYLLRVTPPRPREVAFPPLKLILDLRDQERTPAHTPWWLLALRLLIAALVILAVSGPVWNPVAGGDTAKGPLLIVLDDGWAAAPAWQRRIKAASDRVVAAEREGRASAVAVVSDGGRRITPGDAAKTLERLNALKPQPYLPDRAALLPAVQAFAGAHKDLSIVWICDGLAAGNFGAFAKEIDGLAPQGGLTFVREARAPRAITEAVNAPDALSVRVMRSVATGEPRGRLRALDLKGIMVGEAPFDFAKGSGTTAKFQLPIELRNEIARIEMVDERSAGAVTLLDDRWKRRRVGIVSGATADQSQPLLAPSYYLTKALLPFADVREIKSGSADPIIGLLDDKVAMLIMADVGVVEGPARQRLDKFIDEGGVLVRFAGTRLAGASDDLLPVKLRRGGRTLGGALSWEQPRHLAAFDRASPLFGLPPSQEVTISRQVLAEPDPGLSAKTWASLTDGTPLVTAQRQGKGWIVLVHVTADTTWSNLPLSGLFVDMLHRFTGLATTAAAAASDTGNADSDAGATQPGANALAPVHTLDGYGELGAPPVTAKPIPATFAGAANADHPPGFYGVTDAFVVVNPLGPKDTLAPAVTTGLSARMEYLRTEGPVDLRPWLLATAVVGLLLDGVAWLWLSGGILPRVRHAAATLALLGVGAIGTAIVVAAPPPARAAEMSAPLSKRDMNSVLTTRLAYVISGDSQVDEASRLGLTTLTRTLSARTSLTAGDPVGVDPAHDELAFYPLLYWPVVASKPQPPGEAVQRIAAFMKHGGTVVFDTRDALTALPSGPPTPEAQWLQKLLANVDVPPLEPVPADHVVTKTFYLIDGFIGRTTVGQTWIEALPPEAHSDPSTRPARAGDGVSPVIITSNDLAGAWAMTASGDPLYPLVPGGNRQRELALRGGVNLVMYAMTGNYKADQVHVKDLLERLGH